MKRLGIAGLLLIVIAIAYVYWIDRQIHPEFLASLVSKEESAAPIVTLLFNPDNRIVAVGYEDGDIDVYDASNNQHLASIDAHEYRVSRLSSSAHESLLASSSYFEKTTRIWDPMGGQALFSIPDTRGPEVFSSDGNTLYMARGSELTFYDLLTNELSQVKYRTNGVITSLALSPDGQYLAAGTTGKIQVWEIMASHEGIAFWDMVRGHRKISLKLVSEKAISELKDWTKLVAFTQDSRQIVSVSRFGGVNVFDSPHLTARRTFASQLKHVRSASYVAEQHSVLLTGTEDRVGIGKREQDGRHSGLIQFLPLDSSAPGIVIDEVSYSSIATAIWPSKVALVADNGKFLVFDLSGSVAGVSKTAP